MASGKRVPVAHGVAAARLDTDDTDDRTPGNTLALRNSGIVDAFLGGEDVTTADGWTLEAGAVLVLDVAESLYAVVDGATDGEIEVLRVR